MNGGAGSRRCRIFSPFILAFFRPFTLSPCVCPSVLLSCDFAPFPCVFWRFRVWRCGVRFAVFILTPFSAVSRLVSARLVQSIKEIKKPVLGAIFKAFCVRGVSAFVRVDAVKGKGKKDNKKGQAVKPAPRCGYLCRFSISSICCRVIVFSLAYRVAFATSARVAPFGKIAVKIRNFSQISVAVPLAVIMFFVILSPSVIYCH